MTCKELDDDLGGWADHDLALAGLLGVVDGLERIVEDGSLDHFGGMCGDSQGGDGGVRYLQQCHVSLQEPWSVKSALQCLEALGGFFSSVVAGAAVSLSAEEMSAWPWLPEGHLWCIVTYLLGAASLCWCGLKLLIKSSCSSGRTN